ncbi:MAG: hypothetical protein ACXV6K_10645 [Halobacteriota archaeon]
MNTSDVTPEQDKVRMEHYVPLHHVVFDAIAAMLDGREDDTPAFLLSRCRAWPKDQQVMLIRCGEVFQLSDLRKFCEQHRDVIGWDHSNRAYILTHGVSGVDWTHYKHPLPEHVPCNPSDFIRANSKQTEKKKEGFVVCNQAAVAT